MINRRLEFTKQTKRDADERSGGICECHRLKGIAGFTGEGCGIALGPGNRFFEHIICDGLRKDNSLDNCAVLTKTCWKRKTAWDQPVVAKAKRVWDAWRGINGRTSQPVPGSRNTPFIKRMNRAVDRRPGW
jgi:hypothetical protein